MLPGSQVIHSLALEYGMSGRRFESMKLLRPEPEQNKEWRMLGECYTARVLESLTVEGNAGNFARTCWWDKVPL